MEYPLCDQTVTVYRRTAEGVRRKVVEGCHFSRKDTRRRDVPMDRRERAFLLVIPGEDGDIALGDRVLEGIGPKEVDWSRFVPAAVEGLCEVAYVTPYCFGGRLCHTEAGRK